MAEILQRFLIVGGLFGAQENVPPAFAQDQTRLQFLQNHLRAAGFALAPQPQITLCNFLHGEDFLARSYRADVVLLSLVPDLPATTRREVIPHAGGTILTGPFSRWDKEQTKVRRAFTAAQARGDYSSAMQEAAKFDGLVSRHASPQRWARKLEATRATILASVSVGLEVDLMRLPLKKYAPLESGAYQGGWQILRRVSR